MAWHRENAKRLLRLSTSKRDSTLIDSRRHSLAASLSSSNSPYDGSLCGHEFERNAGALGAAEEDGSIPAMANLGNEKVVTSGNGITVSISLAEPVLFLEGYERNDRESRKTAMIRGSLRLHITKHLKIKKVYLNFRGQAISSWPEGGTRLNWVPGKRPQSHRTQGIMNHTWTFFNAQFPTAEHGYGTDQVQINKDSAVSAAKELDPSQLTASTARIFDSDPSLNSMPRDQRRRSLQHVQSRTFGDQSPSPGSTVAQRGHKWFLPGDYIYNFELPIDSWYPETIKSEVATIQYKLEAMVERWGAFRPNLVGSREIPFIRTPSDLSLEQVEPIAITRTWDDQLHYEVIISGKTFPLGAQVPIAFKLTPLAKVACHRVRVYVTESIQQWSHKRSVDHNNITKRLLLFEKRPDAPFESNFPGGSVRVTAGGGIDSDQRAASARGKEVFNPERTSLLGDIESDFGAGPTEMEFDVQLPTCSMMKERNVSEKLHPDASSGHVEVNHWIKIVLRLSKADEDDPSKRRHFEISIDSPFHIMSCLARQANIYLPAYTTPSSIQTEDFECGCPDSSEISQSSRRLSAQGINPFAEPLDMPFTPSHEVSSPASSPTPDNQAARPIHFLRLPSYDPPAFDDMQPPPPLLTPPPDYASAF